MYNRNLEPPNQQIMREQFLKEHSPPINTSRFEVYKKYSKTANKTLTTFANEMSEILRESMEHMDCLNLMVRGVCTPSGQLNTQSLNIDQKGDRGGLLKYKHVLKQDFNSPIPAYTVNNKPSIQATSKPAESQLSVKKNNQQLVRQIQDMKQSGDANKKVIAVPKNPSIVLLESSMSLRYNNEKSVMETIKKQHKQLSSSAKKSPSKEDLDGKSTSENLESRNKSKKQKRCKRKVKRKFAKPADEPVGIPIFEINADENSKLDDSHTDVKKGVKYTRLSRKYANENFHNIAPKDPILVTEGDQYGGKKIKIQSDNKQDWSVIMHTQKTTRPDSRLTSCRVANILESITLKDLEPLKAEYPRKDHIAEQVGRTENSLLHNLVNANTKSLELLVDINKLQAKYNKTGALPSRNNSKIIIKQVDSLRKFTMLKSTPRAVVIKGSKRKVLKRKVLKDKKGSESSCKTAIDMREYQMYKKLTGNNTTTRLKKYMTDPQRSYNQEIIVMPVFVDFDKEYLPDISEGNSKETVVPEDILKPYIYTNVSSQISRAPTAIMTMTIPNMGEMNKRLHESNKPVVKASAEPSVLVQRVVNCKQPKTTQAPMKPSRSQSSDGSQLISFIVNKEKQSVVDTLYSPSKCSRKSSASEKVSPKRNIKARVQTKTSDLRAAIDGMERKLKEIIDQPDKRNPTIMQNMEQEMKSILSQMQIDAETTDYSVASSSTNSSIYTLERGKSIPRSKTNLEGTPKPANITTSNVQSRKPRPQTVKPVQQQSASTSATSYTTTCKDDSTTKLMTSLESQKVQTNQKNKEIKVIKVDRKSATDRFKMKQQNSVKPLKHKPVKLDLEKDQREDSIIELKKPPKSPRRPPELHVIMAPERDYNNSRTKKDKVEDHDSMYAGIKFTTPHTNISIPREVKSKSHAELNMIFTQNEKNKPVELKESPKKERKESNEINQPTETPRQKKVNSKILDKWQTLEHPSLLQVNNQISTDETKDVLDQTPKEVKNDAKREVVDHRMINHEANNETKPEVLDHGIINQAVNNETKPDVLDNRIIHQEANNETKPEVLNPRIINQVVNNEIKLEVLDHPIKSNMKEEEEVIKEGKQEPKIMPNVIKEIVKDAKQQETVCTVEQEQKLDSVCKVRPFTADSTVVKKHVEGNETVNVEQILKKTLEEESKGLCNDVNEVLHKIQEVNVAHLNTKKITGGSQQNVKMQKVRSEEFWTPFMHAVKKFRKEEPSENFYDFMKDKGHIRGSTEIIRHKASMNCIASELYITKRMMQVTYKDWTDSELNVQKPDTDSSPEHSSRATPPRKCLKRMNYHERLSEIAKKKLDLMKTESVKKQETVVTQTKELPQEVKSKRIQFDESNLQKVMDEMANESNLQLALCDPECSKYDKFLTCFYGLMFMTIFCGLNLKYSCS